jgi:hypothetical protein
MPYTSIKRGCEKKRVSQGEAEKTILHQADHTRMNEISGSSEERYREPKHSRRRTAQPRKKDRARSIGAPLSEEE